MAGLSPSTYYYYRFMALGDTSVTGRTLTAPVGTVNHLRFGVVSCSDFRRGYFHAYQKMAERNDLNAVLHLGDYIYEGGGGVDRIHDPNSEAYRLQDYRTRYSQYHLDTSLQRCHQVHPFITSWDDHDVVVDALRDTSYRHDAAAFGPYMWRKYAAIRAAREWLPMRDPDSVSTHFFKNWREFHYGSLADIFMLDARLYDRDRFATDVSDTIYGDPGHRIIGPEQMTWLNDGLRTSTAQWKIIGNQVMLSQFTIGGTPLVLENWDGYPAERNQVYDNLEANSISNVVVVTGDFHCSFANDVPRDALSFPAYNPFTGDGSLCAEFVVPSITGDNYDEGNDFGLGAGNAALAQTLIQIGNPHTKYVNLTAHGYILLDVDASRAQAEFMHMADVRDEANLAETLAAAWYAADGSNHIAETTTASSPVAGTPLPPALPCRPVAADAPVNAVLMSMNPNPASDFAWLHLGVNTAGNLRVTLSDLTGRLEKEFCDQDVIPGHYLLEMDVRELAAGLHLLVVETGSQKISSRLLIVR